MVTFERIPSHSSKHRAKERNPLPASELRIGQGFIGERWDTTPTRLRQKSECPLSNVQVAFGQGALKSRLENGAQPALLDENPQSIRAKKPSPDQGLL